MRKATSPALTVALLLLGALATSGCGLVQVAGGGPVRFTFTEDYGAKPLGTASERLPRALNAVNATNRVHPLPPAPPGSAWSLYVNGISPPNPPKLTFVHPGDRVWWDLHSTRSGAVARAVIGAFPEPFVHGAGGKRLPTTLECADDVSTACGLTRDALARQGVPRTYQVLGTGSGTDTIGVVVGTQADLQAEVVAALIARGPAASGVFARFVAGGSGLQLLSASGSPAATLTGDVGLIAATGDQIAEPDWVITGTDPAGVAAAARVFARNPAAMHDRFALAVRGDRVIPLPAGGR